MEKLKLFRIYDIETDERDGKLVVGAKKEFIADLETEDDALQYPKELEELYIIKFDENDEPIGVHAMVFGECECLVDDNFNILDEPCGVFPPSLDCVEHDFRVYASVAFDKDWV